MQSPTIIWIDAGKTARDMDSTMARLAILIFMLDSE
jgi:hypothetical protein